MEFEPHLSLDRYRNSSSISRSTARVRPAGTSVGCEVSTPLEPLVVREQAAASRTPTPLTLRSRAGSLHVFLQVRHFVLDFKKAAPLLGTASP